MTDILTAPGAHLTGTSLRITAIGGLVGGCALLVDTITITVINRSFGALDDALFFLGLAGLLVCTTALAVALSARAHGPARVGLGLLVLVATLAVVFGLATVMDTIGHHVFSSANIGLHGEWSFFTVGVCLMAIAGWAGRRARETAPALAPGQTG
jgi:hypothetical protein